MIMKKAIRMMALMLMFIGIGMQVSAKSAAKTETVVFTVAPQMTCQNCENKIKSNLRFESGVTDIVTSLQNQTVTVTFNPEKTDRNKIVEAFKKIGYTATECTSGAPACVKGHDGCGNGKGKCGDDKKGCGSNGNGHCGACKHKH